ncbi:hypothetical protein [Xanthomonas oryzae]|uniref:hypothetical protein n=1 Tax=Xanthomonas oryzae TaxID=347 RepID=UPI001110086D|nr:hypothetical protein [Xanthomonas oryzae]
MQMLLPGIAGEPGFAAFSIRSLRSNPSLRAVQLCSQCPLFGALINAACDSCPKRGASYEQRNRVQAREWCWRIMRQAQDQAEASGDCCSSDSRNVGVRMLQPGDKVQRWDTQKKK